MTANRRIWAEWWIDAEHTATATKIGPAYLGSLDRWPDLLFDDGVCVPSTD